MSTPRGISLPESAGVSVESESAQRQLEACDPPADLVTPDLTANAVSVLERRYLKKDPETGEVVETPQQLFWRVATCVARPESAYDGGSVDRALLVAREFYELMALRKFMPNSPCLMNAGREMGMLSACFVIPVEDSIEGIFDAIKATALIQKAGGGTGFSFSRLRPQGDLVRSSGGTTEGPMSFIQVFSQATDAIQQGAFRRGANMGILRVDHPDVLSFISFKEDRQKLQNYNVSVAVTDRFVEQLRSDPDAMHQVQNPRTKEWSDLPRTDEDGKPTGEAWTVGQLWDRIIDRAHDSGEPGIVFIDRINERNPIKNVGLIEATNPCGEQPLHAYDSCNLGSINLGVLVKHTPGAGGPEFDWDEYRTIIHTTTRFLDNVIEVNRYPLPQIDNMSKTTRRIGLGVMGFADALYKLGIPYNSEEGAEFGQRVMEVLNDESHLASEILGEERGVFPAWEGSDWQKQGRRLRNSYTTTVAPTGTISIIANCSGGIEPMFSLAFTRNVMKDTQGRPTVMKEVNYVFENLAREQGFYTEEMVEQIIAQGTLAHVDDIPGDIKDVFVTAHDITPYWHMRMQAAFQRHCDSSISKTINFPREASAEDVREIYELAIDQGVKGVTVYRDGCREMQPMSLKKSAEGDEAQATEEVAAHAATVPADGSGPLLTPIRLPEIMSCLRVRQMTPFGNMHVKVSVDPISEREREVFAQLGKGGDVANSDLEAICRILSLWLRSNGSLELAVKQLDGIGSSLTVPTKDGRIMSLADGLARALRRYLKAKLDHGLQSLLLGQASTEPGEVVGSPAPTGESTTPRSVSQYKIVCPSCSEGLAFEEGCVKCYSCGFSQC
ncbi:MAG: adenosylcobalamin-dependent ribonucleoside-diphosphate reductase [Planctomycetota bacterium]|nr:adenosylcobalamin-dependent ribonucleoside-diphosphate reductase [Planctomycetota bacterium]MDP6762673.1 adenosylcobalamin-dependent ribonucleoside-diphosphate reductase [Planctomycetota bacterium]